MVNYSNGKIYKIVCDTTGLVYIGSTTKKYLSSRLSEHTSKYKSWKEGKARTYYSGFQVLEANTYFITLLELVDCKTKDELVARERYYIDTIPCVNKNIPSRTKKEYYEANKEIICIQQKAINIKFKETHKERLFKKTDCECGGRYSHLNQARHLTSQKHLNFVASKYLENL